MSILDGANFKKQERCNAKHMHLRVDSAFFDLQHSDGKCRHHFPLTIVYGGTFPSFLTSYFSPTFPNTEIITG